MEKASFSNNQSSHINEYKIIKEKTINFEDKGDKKEKSGDSNI